jgi:hypothetical protein
MRGERSWRDKPWGHRFYERWETQEEFPFRFLVVGHLHCCRYAEMDFEKKKAVYSAARQY